MAAPTMSKQDQDALAAAGEAWNKANAAGDEAGKAAAHAQAEAIRNSYGYSGGGDGSKYIPTGESSGSGGSKSMYSGSSSSSSSSKSTSSGSSGSSSTRGYTASDMPASPEKDFMSPSDYEALKQAGADYLNAKTEAEKQAAHDRAEEIRGRYNYSGGEAGDEFIPLPPKTPDFSGLLDDWLNAAKEQQQNQIDYAVDKGVADLERAEADAQEQFQTQQNQVSEDEAKALDNQALYAEARGDRGGIGQAQYGQIQAQAMQNRQAINTARTKLSTDTARAIADLRAQGEFQKADALLQLTQTYLSQLIQLQQWGAEYSLNVQQFNAQLQQWEKEFELSVGDLMGEYQGKPTWSAQQAEKNTLVESGMAALSVGVRPSAAQQQAMGYTDAQIDAILAEYKLSQMTSGSSGRGSSGGSSSKGTSGGSGSGTSGASGAVVGSTTYQKMYAAGIRSEGDAYDYLTSVLGLSSTEAAKKAEYFSLMEDELAAWYQEQQKASEWANAKVDWAQVHRLFGVTITEEGLAQKVANGEATMYLEDGYLRFLPVNKGQSGIKVPPLTSFPGLPSLS